MMVGLGALAVSGCRTAPMPVPPPPGPAPPACLIRLQQAGEGVTAANLAPTAEGCRIADPVRATRLGAAVKPAVLMDCALAETLTRFEHEVAAPLARRWFKADLASLDNFGAYACRPEVSTRTPRLSQHAFGRAFDLSGVTLADGRRMTVLGDWAGTGPKAQFLHQLAQAACGIFSVVLSPTANAQHRDHLHLDIGPDRYCAPPPAGSP